MKFNIFKMIPVIAFIFSAISTASLFADEIEVNAVVEKNELFTGESFIYQISIKGSRDIAEPQLDGGDNFTAAYLGMSDQSSTFISIVNNKQTVTEKIVYILQFRLTPKKKGVLRIPSVMVNAGGRNFMTDPIDVTVREPSEVEDYKLRVNLSASRFYAGEKVIVTVIWYLGKDVKAPIDFSIPLFDDPRFSIIAPPSNMDQKKEYVTLVINNEQINAEHSNGTLGGTSYDTISFSRILIAKNSGMYMIPQATIGFQGVTGSRKVRDFFGNVFDQPSYGKMVVPSNPLSFTVLTVPETGKPANYSGLIGSYSIEAAAAPQKVRVGDPITLTITLKGSGFLDDAKLPPLDEIPELSANFKIPQDMGPAELKGNSAVFIQTLRALNDRITEIPQIKIPYFNSKSGKYEYAVSQPIKISVEPATSELSIYDLEGRDPIEMKRELSVWEEGIAANYQGFDVLENQASGLPSLLANPLLLLLLILPVISYFTLLYIFRFSPLVRGDRSLVLARKYYMNLKNLLSKEPDTGDTPADFHTRLLETLKAYLGAKLKSKAESLTFTDIEKPLRNHGLSGTVVDELKKIFTACEQARYSGASAGGNRDDSDIREISRKTLELAAEIERSFT